MKQNSPDDYSRFYGTPKPPQNPPENPYPNYYQSPKPIVTAPPKPKQPFSPIPLLLVAGVIFLFLGGIIFLTNTWSILSDGGRAVGLLSASVIAFGANQLAERVFKLKKTGLAFYILGCIFLPLALCGIGVFQLFGDWLSFHGDGVFLLLSIVFLSVTVTTFFGQKKYESPLMAFVSLLSTAGVWWTFSAFLTQDIVDFKNTVMAILILLYAGISTGIAEYYLQKHYESVFTKILPGFLYLIPAISAWLLMMIAEDARVAVGICSLLTGVLFCNPRFIQGKNHLGILGTTACLLISSYQVTEAFSASFAQQMAFMFGMTSIILMSLQQMPKLRQELTQTYSSAGMVLAVTVASILGLRNFVLSIPEALPYSLIHILMIVGTIFFFRHSEIHPSRDSLCLIANSFLLFEFSILNQQNHLVMFLLVISALLLLIQAIIRKKIWAFSMAICTSISAILSGLSESNIYIVWLVAVAMLLGTIYANKTKRYFLERGCVLTFLSFLTPAFVLTATHSFSLKNDTVWILALSVVGLLYLAETFLFQKELRTNQTRPYLETESLLLSVISFIYYLDLETSKGFGILLCLLMLIFSAGFLRKNINLLALPQLILSFCLVVNLTDSIESNPISALVYLGLFLLYIAMSRLLLPGFFRQENGVFQIDWALLAGIMPLFAIVDILDWYPSVLTCFLLAVYSLFYIGRTRNPSVPLLMTSAFSCLTIFFHNINDPFKVLSILHETEMKTPEILLYLLPLHLFILSLLWILPKKHHSGVHNARFVMYCITMITLLITSFSFKVASDAIFLMIFSFLIVLGSFRVKKLRWFALGFSVLFLTTLRLTWTFWTSLHWGIYLFLAGVILITVASVTEYKNRYYAEHPDEPKKKFEPFKEWVW